MQQKLFDAGLELISESKVGVLLLAGGQGTRLSATAPKGMFIIETLKSQKSLFQIQAEKLKKLIHLAEEKFHKKCILPWYIMTSPFTYDETKEYFEQNKYFGLDSSHVLFFNQDKMPCLTLDGKIILESKSKVASGPNGNGGVYQALERNGILDHMKQHGIEHIHSYCVDNILVKLADPVFIAHCALKKVDFGTKVLPKRDPHERVGVFAVRNNKYCVVEYSEITKEMAERRDSNNTLAFNAGNIANFYYHRDFLVDCANILKTYRVFHVAKKQIPCADENGHSVTPKDVNGVKLELFNFDICQFAKSVALFEVDRFSEFSPLKNKSGSPADTPETCHRDLTLLNIHFLEKAGAIILNKPKDLIEMMQNLFEYCCEIDYSLTYNGEGLEELVKGKTFKLPIYLTKSNL